MRILVATDGSAPAAIGCQLGRDLATLSHGEIRITAVLPPSVDLFAGAWPAAAVVDPEPLERVARDELQDHLRQELDRTPGDLRPSSTLLTGRPAEEIVTEAGRWHADVIVVGSRGHGTLSSILLGSVSEEVVDLSSVPVLIARRPRVRRLVVAFDGSPAAQAAVDCLTRDETFHGLEAWVVDVAPTACPWWLGVSVADTDSVRRLLDLNEAARRTEQAGAEQAAAALRTAGLVANSRHRIGDAAEELVSAAAAVGADTMVIGSRGDTGLSRLILGSVTRHVVRHAPTSVLIVHPAHVAEPSATAGPTAVPLGGGW
jgi:nucleotide-binding universal stress UspA family protein